MSDVTNAAVLKAIEDRDARFEKLQDKTNEVLGDLAGGMRDLTTIMKANARQGMNEGGSGVTLANVLLIIGAVATVAMVMISFNSREITKIVGRMEVDNVRERLDAGQNSQQSEKIRALERRAYGKSEPCLSSVPAYSYSNPAIPTAYWGCDVPSASISR